MRTKLSTGVVTRIRYSVSLLPQSGQKFIPTDFLRGDRSVKEILI